MISAIVVVSVLLLVGLSGSSTLTKAAAAKPNSTRMDSIWMLALGVGVMYILNLPATPTTTMPTRDVNDGTGMIAVAHTASNSVPSGISGIAPLFHPEVQKWSGIITQVAAEYNLDPNMLATVMQIESCGWQGAVSGAGAQGLFQVMPFHFEAGEDMKDPLTNARRGAAYLAERLIAANGDPVAAFAQYNGGGNALSPVNRLPETNRYVYWATGIYADAQQGKASSDRLDEWLRAGGSELCLNAQKENTAVAHTLYQFPADEVPIIPPYLDEYWTTQGHHGASYGHFAIDISAGKGATVVSPITGIVSQVYTDEWGNPTLVIENSQFVITMLHGNWTVSSGQLVSQGEPVGTEGNFGYTTDMDGVPCASTGRDCGYHTHIDIKDTQGRSIDPFLYIPYVP